MNKFGIAVIGASMRSLVLFDYLNRNPQQGYITGVYDIVPPRGEYLIKKYYLNDAVVYKSIKEAVSDRICHAVFIGTPDGQHVEAIKEALAKGKHVYCEKPLATTLEDCDEIIQTACESKKVFYLGMNLRHSPIYKKLHEIVSNGQIGKLLTIEANEYYFGGRTYFRRWNRLREFSGGLWVTKACHDFDLLNWFSGGKPRRVFATSNLSYYKPEVKAGAYCRICSMKDSCPDFYDVVKPEASGWMKSFCELARLTEEFNGQPQDICLFNSEKDTFDNGMSVVEYDNDVRASYCLNVVSARATRQMRLTGTEGSAESDMHEGIVRVWKRYSDDVTEYNLCEQMNSGHGGADDRILEDFLQCCRVGKKPASSWADGRLSVQLSLASRESCDMGHSMLIAGQTNSL